MKMRSYIALIALIGIALSSCDDQKSENSITLDFGNDTLDISIGQGSTIEGTYTSKGPTPISFSTSTLPSNSIGKFTVFRQNSNVKILGPSPFPVLNTATTEPHQYVDILIEVNANNNAVEGVYPLDLTARALDAELYEPAQKSHTIYLNIQNNDASCIPQLLGGYTVNDDCSAGNPYSGTVVQSPTANEVWFNFPGWGSALAVGQVLCPTSEIIIPVQTVTTSTGATDIEGTATFSDETGEMIITVDYTRKPSGSSSTPINCSATWTLN